MNCLKKLISLILVDLFKKTNYDNTVTEAEGKFSGITGLATTAAFTALMKKIPKVIDLVKKNRLCCKNIRLEKNIFTIFDCNKFTDNIHDLNIKN